MPRVPNYLGGRDRRNVTMFVLGGGFLLLIASNFQGFSKFARAVLPGQASRVDTRVPLPAYREPLPYEAVQLLPFDEDSSVDSALAKQEAGSPAAEEADPEKKDSPTAALEVETPPPASSDPSAKLPNHRKYYSAVNVPLLATIQNDAPFRNTETEVWFHLLDVVNKAAPEQLKKEATPIYDFATIFGQSNYYRGQAISLTGIAKWYMEIPSNPKDNAAGIAKFYQVGFQINAQEDNPMMVYVVDLPADMPRGVADPQDPTRFTLKPGVPFAVEGIFFKNYAHVAGDGEFRLYPALLAKTIRLKPTGAAAEPPTNPMVYLLALACLGGVFFLLMYFLSVKRKKISFVIPAATSPLAIDPKDVDLNDSVEPKEQWPVLPEEK